MQPTGGRPTPEGEPEARPVGGQPTPESEPVTASPTGGRPTPEGGDGEA